MAMGVAELWRYPVKSMAGERLERAELDRDGVAGDRVVRVVAGGRLVTSRTRPGLLGVHATTRWSCAHLEGYPWTSPEAAELVRIAAGADARLSAASPAERFDVLSLLVATDGAIAAFGRDGRRLRPNIVVSGVPGLDERRRRPASPCCRTAASPDRPAMDAFCIPASARARGSTDRWAPEPRRLRRRLRRRGGADHGVRRGLGALPRRPGGRRRLMTAARHVRLGR